MPFSTNCFDGTANYVYDGANIVAEYDSNGTLVAHYDQGAGVDEPLAMSRGGALSFFEADGLGSITSLTDGAGATASTYEYDAFGNAVNTSGTVVNSYRYTGREWDSETGLYYYRARYYDPSIGGFISEDPIGAQQGPNLYLYVKGNPVNSVDPTGRYTIDKSCKNKCQAMGGGGPNNPAQPPTDQNLEQVIQQQTDLQCSNLSSITDAKLRSCIQKSCDKGKIKCKTSCDSGTGAYQRTILFFFGKRTANLCTSNWPSFTPLSYVGGAVIHEWAHGCGWDHGQGGGVPMNSGGPE